MEKDPDETTLIVAETISDALETPVEELPPLEDAIDLDALNAIIPSTPADSPPYVTVAFSYSGLNVGVRAGNTVFVSPIGGESEEPLDYAHLNER